MKQIALAVVILASLGLSGCATAYTNISKVGEGKYLVTENKAGIIAMSGKLFLCEGGGKVLKCQEVASE